MENQDLISKLKELKKLEAAGRPRADWVLSSREILMSQIQPKIQASQPVAGDYVYYWRYFGEIFVQRVLRPAVTVAAMVAALLTYDATVSVADESVTGDVLYPVKSASEQIQLALTFDEDKKVQLQMDFTKRRVAELQKIAARPEDGQKARKVTRTVQDITNNVKVVQDKLNKINAAFSPSESAIAMAKEVDSQTSALKEGIILMNQSLSDEVKSQVDSQVKEVIKASEQTSASALDVMVKGKEAGVVSDEEMAGRLSDRIKATEASIAQVAGEIAKIATSSSLIVIDSSKAMAKLQEAEKALEEAKDLLDQKDFASAMAKLQVAEQIIADVVKQVEVVNIGGMVQGTSTQVTSTQILIK